MMKKKEEQANPTQRAKQIKLFFEMERIGMEKII